MARLVIILVVVALGALPARVGRPADPAKQAFERGTRALDQGRFADAVRLFESCLARSQKTACGFNLAVALRGVGDFLRASDTLSRLLKGEWGPMPALRTQQAESLLRESRDQIATVDVSVEAGNEDVELRWDGQLLVTGKVATSFTVRANPGEHVLLVSAAGFEPREERLALSPGELREHRVELVPSRATLVVETRDANNVIEVLGVGTAVGQFQARLEAGTYTVRVSGPQGEAARQVELEPGATLRIQVDPESSSSWLHSPWLWTGVGVAVAAAVTVAVVFATRDELVAIPGRPNIQALRP